MNGRDSGFGIRDSQLRIGICANRSYAVFRSSQSQIPNPESLLP